MELVQILRSLWMMRYVVAVGFVLAAAVAVGLYVKDESVEVGTASAEILIDGEQSALGDLRLQTLPLVARSSIFARFVGADGVTDAIAREAGIPKRDIAVVPPKLRIDGVADPESAERASRLRGTASHLLQVQQGDNLPLLTVFTQGPTQSAARKLADATAGALERYVTEQQEEAAIPDRRRVKIRQLGPARAGMYESKPSLMLSGAAFCFLFGMWCFGLLALRYVASAWRSPGPWIAPPPDGVEFDWDGPTASNGHYEVPADLLWGPSEQPALEPGDQNGDSQPEPTFRP